MQKISISDKAVATSRMHITQVTIQGFKSYSELTTIGPFDPGHNVVVGRNGSVSSPLYYMVLWFIPLGDMLVVIL